MTPILIYCSTPTKEQSQEIANHLIQAHLAACVTIVPKTISTYIFDNEFEESKESLMLIKSFDLLFERIAASIKTLHSYRVPEIIAQPLPFVDASYLAWMKDMVQESIDTKNKEDI